MNREIEKTTCLGIAAKESMKQRLDTSEQSRNKTIASLASNKLSNGVE